MYDIFQIVKDNIHYQHKHDQKKEKPGSVGALLYSRRNPSRFPFAFRQIRRLTETDMGNPLVTIYKKLPESKKKVISDYFTVLKKIVRYGLELRFKVYEDLEEKKVVYITPDEPDTGFLEYFFPGVTVTRVNTIYAWSLPAFVRRQDKVIIDMNHCLARFFSGGITTFPWIRQRLDITTGADELLNRKWILRERKKAEQFQPVFSTDPADLDLFYEKMYVAYIMKRFKDPGIIKKAIFQKSLGKTSELCLLKKDGQPVAGCLFDHVGDAYILLTLGVTDEAYVKEGATAALYYYGIRRAHGLGAKYIDFGLSRPFISDGVLQYKGRWGGRIGRNHDTSQVTYLKNIRNDGLIVLDEDKLKVLVSADNAACRELAADAGMEVKIVDNPLQLKISNLFNCVGTFDVFSIIWLFGEIIEEGCLFFPV
jgi:hypothetical protein